MRAPEKSVGAFSFVQAVTLPPCYPTQAVYPAASFLNSIKGNSNVAQRGGKRPGAGRPAGRRDTATLEQKATIEDLARSHAPTALNVLVQIATAGESEGSRVAAANSIIDRGYGKPKQATEVTGKDGERLIPDGGDMETARRLLHLIVKAEKA